MPFYKLTLAILAVWRVTHLLNAEDGPGNLLVRLRRLLGQGLFGGLVDCFYCLSLWVAAPVALGIGETWQERMLLWPALSAGAICLERFQPGPPPAPYFEDGEDDHVLRQGEKTGLASGTGPAGTPELDGGGAFGPGGPGSPDIRGIGL